MQVISLLNKLKAPEAVQQIKWKSPLARAILRFEKCLNDVGFGFIFVLMVSVVGGVTAIASAAIGDGNPSFGTVVWHCIMRAFLCALLGTLFIYVCWEIRNGWRWLKNWAAFNKEKDAS